MCDHNGQQLAYVYFEDEPGRGSAAKLLSKDEGGGLQRTLPWENAVMAVTDKLGGSAHNPTMGEQLMPLSTLVPFALVAVIGIVVLYAAYRAGA